MSDNFIILIPEDPTSVPAHEERARARAWLEAVLPKADEYEVIVQDEIGFFDCGENFERVLCPVCRSDLDEWWGDRIHEELDARPAGLRTYVLPCCANSLTLNDLQYEWPQGFARFALRIRNAGVGELKPEVKREIESILGVRLRLIYCRY